MDRGIGEEGGEGGMEWRGRGGTPVLARGRGVPSPVWGKDSPILAPELGIPSPPTLLAEDPPLPLPQRKGPGIRGWGTSSLLTGPGIRRWRRDLEPQTGLPPPAPPPGQNRKNMNEILMGFFTD